MNLFILNESKQSLGGGWSFIRNLEKGLKENKDVILVSDWKDSDVVLIPSPSMVTRETVTEIKASGKKIVLRLDNIPRNSRNRGAGTSRMYDIAQMADKIVYQSKWAEDYLLPFVGKEGVIIYNGVDREIFQPTGLKYGFKKEIYDKVYLYCRYNRDETKGWEKVWYRYQMIQRENPNALFVIVGNYSDELKQYNFDFFMNENIEYMGVIDDPETMACIMRGCDILLAPYFNDCYSNTIQEAMACGLELEVDSSGGTDELIKNGVRNLKQMSDEYMEVFKNVMV